jgi:hypothetical protein
LNINFQKPRNAFSTDSMQKQFSDAATDALFNPLFNAKLKAFFLN